MVLLLKNKFFFRNYPDTNHQKRDLYTGKPSCSPLLTQTVSCVSPLAYSLSVMYRLLTKSFTVNTLEGVFLMP